jgi:hypothetical protein
MPNYTVAQGDCLSSIGAKFGFAPDTLWNLGENAELKLKRKDPNVLYPGDVVFVPDLRVKEVSCATDQSHKFEKKGVPAKLRIRLLDDQQPRANIPYQLQIDGKSISGTTDGDGYIEQPLPPGAQTGRLIVGNGNTREVHDLAFGTVDPIDTDSGVNGRLRDLGFQTGADPSEAIKAFQQKHGMEVNGQMDDTTRQKLAEIFGQ